MNKITKSILLFGSVCVLAACQQSENVATSKVGNVTKDEFYQSLKAQNGEQTLQSLILRKVLESKVPDKDKLHKEAQEKVAEQVKENGGEAAMLQLLSRNGFTSIAAYQDTVYLNGLIAESMKAVTTFSDDELKEKFDSWEPKISAQHILIKGDSEESKKKAEDLIKQLDGGADFSELAKANSEDTGSAQNGGSLGEFARKDMVKEFADEAYSLKENEYSKVPVKSQFGYHIVKVLTHPEKGSFEDSKEAMKEELLQEKLKDQNYIRQTMADFVKEANVSIADKDLQKALDALTKDPVQSNTQE